MTRDQLESAVWTAGGRHLTGEQVDTILIAADEYALGRARAIGNVRREISRRQRCDKPQHRALRHLDDTGADLYPAISGLAELLLRTDAP